MTMMPAAPAGTPNLLVATLPETGHDGVFASSSVSVKAGPGPDRTRHRMTGPVQPATGPTLDQRQVRTEDSGPGPTLGPGHDHPVATAPRIRLCLPRILQSP